MTLLEICLEDVAGAPIAERSGADRIELCTDLARGGTTAALDSVAAVLGSVTAIGVQLLIRPRPGDFVFTGAEVTAMLRDIEAIGALSRPAGVRVGFVVGALTDDGRIDVPVLTRLLSACGPVPVTFHRAFDAVTDQGAALETLIDLGVDRVLTSGGQLTAEAGTNALAALVERAGGRISVLAAGGIRAHNVTEIVRRTGVGEVHLRANRNPDSALTSEAVVRAVSCALQSG